jgi:L-amino acid N-acyltransferase YncA
MSDALPSIRPSVAADSASVADIYNHYVESTIVTFEEEPVSHDTMALRMREVEARGFPWLVAEQGGRVLGYAYAAPWKQRSGYRFSVESTVYLAPDSTGRGLGEALYRELIQRLKGLDVHAVVGGISLPNTESVALHEKCGFRKVAHFREVGRKFERWIDVGYWQLTL